MKPTIDKTMLGVALALSMRGDCKKRQVGCVLVDVYDRIVGSGYNGRPRCLPNCSEKPCETVCEGVHAEINALLQCRGDDVAVAYVTHAPCWHCTKALVNTNCREIVFMDNSTEDERARQLWESSGAAWIHYEGAE